MENTEQTANQEETSLEVEARIPPGRFIAGSYALPDRHTRAGMRTLGDNLNLLARLERELSECWQPRDTMQRLLVADLARLYCRKAHLESAVIDSRLAEYRRVSASLQKYESDPAVSDPPIDTGQADYYGLRSILDSQNAFEDCLYYLDFLLEKVSRREWQYNVGSILEKLYGKNMAPCGQEIREYFGVLADPKSEITAAMEKELSEKLLKLISDDKASTEMQLTAFKNQRREEFISTLPSAWMPTSLRWNTVMVQEAMLDRMISWKIKILLRLQNREAQPLPAPARENSFPVEVDEEEWRFSEGELRAGSLKEKTAGALPEAGQPEDGR